METTFTLKKKEEEYHTIRLYLYENTIILYLYETNNFIANFYYCPCI